jgi:hypothetical protein
MNFFFKYRIEFSLLRLVFIYLIKQVSFAILNRIIKEFFKVCLFFSISAYLYYKFMKYIIENIHNFIESFKDKLIYS